MGNVDRHRTRSAVLPPRPALVAALLVALACGAEAAEARRVAVVVGANRGAAGRADLHFAHSDARAVADVLVEVGQFSRDDVHVLLDPEPDALLFTIDRELQALREAGGESLLVFYYSGHADGQSLYPAGRPLPLRELRRRLDDPRATVRLGIVDACGGGGWTGQKGLSPAEPFQVDVPFELTAEGSALIASSSGQESAHESSGLAGSFFTHHLVAALRGAADSRGDGVVTLNEAFAYAKERTIRDTANVPGEPQHPSFDLHLHGRTDLPLSRTSGSSNRLDLLQQKGPLQVVHLATGLLVAELPAGKRQLRLALPVGRYLVRRLEPGQTRSREVAVEAGHTVRVDEETLALSPTPTVVAKRFIYPPSGSLTTPAPDTCQANLTFGRSFGDKQSSVQLVSGTTVFSVALRCTVGERLLFVPSDLLFGYRLGDRSGWELVPVAGFTHLAPTRVVPESTYGGHTFTFDWNALSLSPTLDLSARRWVDAFSSVDLNAFLVGRGRLSTTVAYRLPFETWSGGASVGYTHGLLDLATLHLALGLTGRLHSGPSSETDPGAKVVLGSVQSVGYQQLPLVRVHFLPWLSVDGFANLAFDLHGGPLLESYQIGFSGEFQ